MNWLKAAWSVGTTIPSLLTGGYGILIRLGLIAAVAGALYGLGWYHGYKHEEVAFDAYQQQVVVDGKVAAKIAQDTKAKQDKTTKDLKDAHQTDVARIRAYYLGVLRDQSAVQGRPGSCPVSAPANGAGQPDAAAAERGPGQQGAIAFELKCALDAEQVMKLQDFLRLNGFPVE